MSHEMPIFIVFWGEKGGHCVWLRLATESREPRHTGSLQKRPFQDSFSTTKSGHFLAPKDPNPAKHLTYGVWLE